jgi:hypothetical protein
LELQLPGLNFPGHKTQTRIGADSGEDEYTDFILLLVFDESSATMHISGK